jgi:SRSO17 transposase
MDYETYPATYQQEWHQLVHRIQHRFARIETYQRAQRYVQGLMSQVKRRNGWQLAEQMGDSTPDGVQRLLNTARWDVDGVRDDLRTYAVEVLGREATIGVIDETGFLKKGNQSAGVKRQYSGTAGRIENCQIGVFLVYATRLGHTLVDRELYLPQEWVVDEARRAAAHIPPTVTFQTKPALARYMLERAQAGGLRLDWVTGDSIYGSDRRLRLWLEEQWQPFVLAVNSNEALWCGMQQQRADALAQRLTASDWHRLSAGDGAKGPRLYDWAALTLPRWGQDPDWQHALLVRRSLSNPDDAAYYVVFAPVETTLHDWIDIAGRRWAIEESFEHAKDELGLDEYEVRHYHGWYRHITLVMPAQVFLNTLRLQAQQSEKNSGGTRWLDTAFASGSPTVG